jgi:hypothetical protein
MFPVAVQVTGTAAAVPAARLNIHANASLRIPAPSCSLIVRTQAGSKGCADTDIALGNKELDDAMSGLPPGM